MVVVKPEPVCLEDLADGVQHDAVSHLGRSDSQVPAVRWSRQQDLQGKHVQASHKAESNSTLFLISGGLTPKFQPCDSLVNKIFKANMSRPHDDHMASSDVRRNEQGYPEAPSRGLLTQWVTRSWDALTADDIRTSFKKAGLLPPFGSEDKAWANKELGSDAQGEPLDSAAPAAGADKADSSSGGANLLEVLKLVDDDDTGVVVLDVSDDEEVEL